MLITFLARQRTPADIVGMLQNLGRGTALDGVIILHPPKQVLIVIEVPEGLLWRLCGIGFDCLEQLLGTTDICTPRSARVLIFERRCRLRTDGLGLGLGAHVCEAIIIGRGRHCAPFAGILSLALGLQTFAILTGPIALSLRALARGSIIGRHRDRIELRARSGRLLREL